MLLPADERRFGAHGRHDPLPRVAQILGLAWPTIGAREGVEGIKKLPRIRAGKELRGGEGRDFALAAQPEIEESTREGGRPFQAALEEGLLMCGLPICRRLVLSSSGEADIWGRAWLAERRDEMLVHEEGLATIGK